MIEIVISSKNPEKQLLIQQIAKEMDISTCLSSDILGEDYEINETGKSYLENAFLKAEQIYRITCLPSIADDYGMEIAGLDGNPGLSTRRMGILYQNDFDLLANTMDMVLSLPPEGRLCSFIGTGVLVYGPGKYISVTQKDCGYLLPEPRGSIIPGHPLASLLLIPEYNKTLSELREEGYPSKDKRIYTYLLSQSLSLLSAK